MQLYGIPNCNTVKKARDFLSTHQIDYSFHDFKKQGVTDALLRGWTAQMPWEKLVNRAGLTWRSLSEAEKSAVIDADSAIKLMCDKPSIIKRPVLIHQDKVMALGFTEASYQALLT